MTKIVLLLFCLSLMGCATHQQFDCPYKEGARCLSVGEIDKKIDAGEIAHTKMAHKSHLTSTSKKSESDAIEPLNPSSLRTKETVLTLWVAPFYSLDGTYHEAQRLHFVAVDAYWRGVNAEIKEDTP